MDNKYKKGEVVFAKIAPKKKLIVMAYKDRIYYCGIDGEPEKKHFAYFERELVGNFTETLKFKKE
jgi:hypothetical protein